MPLDSSKTFFVETLALLIFIRSHCNSMNVLSESVIQFSGIQKESRNPILPYKVVSLKDAANMWSKRGTYR